MAIANYTYNLVVDAGATFSLPMEWQDPPDSPVNLYGYTANMDVRDGNRNLIINLSTANARILLGGSSGTIVLQIAASDTATLPVGKYSYDLFLNAPITAGLPQIITKLLSGTFQVNSTVTVVT